MSNDTILTPHQKKSLWKFSFWTVIGLISIWFVISKTAIPATERTNSFTQEIKQVRQNYGLPCNDSLASSLAMSSSSFKLVPGDVLKADSLFSATVRLFHDAKLGKSDTSAKKLIIDCQKKFQWYLDNHMRPEIWGEVGMKQTDSVRHYLSAVTE